VTTAAAPPTPAPPAVLLGQNHSTTAVALRRVIRPDHAQRGAVATFDGRWYRRAEPGPAGPLILAAASDPDGTTVQVWGPAVTPASAAEHALDAAMAWAGLRDDLTGAEEILTSSPVLRRLVDLVGEVRLGRIPRLGEALGRSIIEQLVQGKEARRSIAQLVARCGTRVDEHRWHWPVAQDLGATPVWDLRRCGISGRMVTALHAAAVEDQRLERARGDWHALDRRLLALPDVGPWTSAEARLRLGDPDAVSVGDYHLPTTVGYGLSGPDGDGPDGTWTDAGMLELLAPYAGQRGRVIRLVEAAAAAGLVARRQRRGPRAALSAHRYW
jgi:3-methyladenine DNA glycosylase/8-oxoguanine DNA glycosylase